MAVNARGFTLAETLIVIAILGIGVSIAVPAMNMVLEKNRLRGAAEMVISQLQVGRSEAIKRNMPLSITFSDDAGTANSTSWCFGLDENPGCDCSITDADDAGACALTTAGINLLKVVNIESHGKVTLEHTFGGGSVTFNPVRGTVNAGSVLLESEHGLDMTVQMSALGRARICSSDILGYSAC